jgi:DNA-binding MarR family transcriptional regulator
MGEIEMSSHRAINDALHSIKSKTRHKMIAEVERNKVEMTYIDHKMMLDIESFGVASQQMLVESMNRDKGQIARIVTRLLRQGLIEKKTHPEDKRSVQLSVTDKGKTILVNLDKVESELVDRMVLGLDQQQIETLIELLNKVDSNLA